MVSFFFILSSGISCITELESLEYLVEVMLFEPE